MAASTLITCALPAGTDAYSTEVNFYDDETMSVLENVKDMTGRIASNNILLLFMLFMFVWLVVSTAISLNVLWNFLDKKFFSEKKRRIRTGIQFADQGTGPDRAGAQGTGPDRAGNRPRNESQSTPSRTEFTREQQRSRYDPVPGGFPHRVGEPYYVSRPDANGRCLGYTQCDLFDAESMTVVGLQRIARRYGLRTSGLREHLAARVIHERNVRDARNCQCAFSVAGGNHWDL